MSLKLCMNALKSSRVLILAGECKNILGYPQKSSQFYRCLSSDASGKRPENTIKQVYYGMLTPQIKAVKMFSVSSSIVGIIAQPFLYKEIVSTGSVPVIIAAYSFIGFFTVITPILLHLITKKYVTHLSYNEKTGNYIAKTVNIFCMTKETEFKVEDVKVPDIPGMFTTLHVNGKALFMDPRMFDYPEHYAKLMGYDKPIDFKLYDNETDHVKREGSK